MIIKYHLLANKKTYYITKFRLLTDPDIGKSRLCQFEQLAKTSNDEYIVDYDVESFEVLLDRCRHGNKQVSDPTKLLITKYLMGIMSVEECITPLLDWMPKYMSQDTGKDKLLTIHLISENKDIQILRSTLNRFKYSMWDVNAQAMDGPNNPFGESINVDLSPSIFYWILDLYRGTNHPYTLPSVFDEIESLPDTLTNLDKALAELDLPTGITGKHDVLFIKNLPRLICPFCDDKYSDLHAYIKTEGYPIPFALKLVNPNNHEDDKEFINTSRVIIHMPEKQQEIKKILDAMYLQYLEEILGISSFDQSLLPDYYLTDYSALIIPIAESLLAECQAKLKNMCPIKYVIKGTRTKVTDEDFTDLYNRIERYQSYINQSIHYKGKVYIHRYLYFKDFQYIEVPCNCSAE